MNPNARRIVIYFTVYLLITVGVNSASCGAARREYSNIDFGFGIRPVSGLTLCIDSANTSIHGLNIVLKSDSCMDSGNNNVFEVSGDWNSETYTDALDQAHHECGARRVSKIPITFGGLKLVRCDISNKSSTDIELFAFRVMRPDVPLSDITYRISAYCPLRDSEICRRQANKIAGAAFLTKLVPPALTR